MTDFTAKRGTRLTRLLNGTSGVALCAIAAMAPSIVLGDPSGGVVVSGQASIGQSGNATVIVQPSQRAVIDWRSFDVANDESVHFDQHHGTSASTLNRVTAGGESVIAGSVTAPGQVIIYNSQGVMITDSASVDVGSFVATSLAPDTERYMSSGQIHLDQNLNDRVNPDARVVNQGQVNVGEAGLAAFVGPHVENSGYVNARLGTAVLASGEAVTLDMYGDDLINIAVTDPAMAGSLSNTGAIQADGGQIVISAADAAALVDQAVNVGGVVRARTIDQQQGRIVLGGAGTGVNINGQVDASGGAGQSGGSVVISGDSVNLSPGASIDVSGGSGGGQVAIGGGLRGGDSGWGGTSMTRSGDGISVALTRGMDAISTLYNTGDITIDEGSVIDASATEAGDGGQVYAWATGSTTFNGAIYAVGAAGGAGGFVETSGASLGVGAAAIVNTGGGTWLLDPTELIIGNAGALAPAGGPGGEDTNPDISDPETVSASAIETALGLNNVYLEAVDLISVNEEISAPTATNSLTFHATGATSSIAINDNIITNGGLVFYAGQTIDIGPNVLIENWTSGGSNTVWLETAWTETAGVVDPASRNNDTITQDPTSAIVTNHLAAVSGTVDLTSWLNYVERVAGRAFWVDENNPIQDPESIFRVYSGNATGTDPNTTDPVTAPTTSAPIDQSPISGITATLYGKLGEMFQIGETGGGNDPILEFDIAGAPGVIDGVVEEVWISGIAGAPFGGDLISIDVVSVDLNGQTYEVLTAAHYDMNNDGDADDPGDITIDLTNYATDGVGPVSQFTVTLIEANNDGTANPPLDNTAIPDGGEVDLIDETQGFGSLTLVAIGPDGNPTLLTLKNDTFGWGVGYDSAAATGGTLFNASAVEGQAIWNDYSSGGSNSDETLPEGMLSEQLRFDLGLDTDFVRIQVKNVKNNSNDVDWVWARFFGTFETNLTGVQTARNYIEISPVDDTRFYGEIGQISANSYTLNYWQDLPDGFTDPLAPLASYEFIDGTLDNSTGSFIGEDSLLIGGDNPQTTAIANAVALEAGGEQVLTPWTVVGTYDDQIIANTTLTNDRFGSQAGAAADIVVEAAPIALYAGEYEETYGETLDAGDFRTSTVTIADADDEFFTDSDEDGGTAGTQIVVDDYAGDLPLDASGDGTDEPWDSYGYVLPNWMVDDGGVAFYYDAADPTPTDQSHWSTVDTGGLTPVLWSDFLSGVHPTAGGANQLTSTLTTPYTDNTSNAGLYDIDVAPGVSSNLTTQNPNDGGAAPYVYDGLIDILRRQLTVTLNNASWTYGDDDGNQDGPNTAFDLATGTGPTDDVGSWGYSIDGGVLSGDTVTAGTTVADINAGERSPVSQSGEQRVLFDDGTSLATITSSLGGDGSEANYTITTVNPGTVFIDPRQLTVTLVDDTLVYGDATTAGGQSVDTSDPGSTFAAWDWALDGGVLFGDDVGTTGTVAASSEVWQQSDVADSPEAVGATGTSSLSGTDAGNYAIATYNDGQITITPAPLTITGVDQSKTEGETFVFDEASPSDDFTVAGLLFDDTVDGVDLFSLGAPASAGAGDYAIDVSNANGSGIANYAITYQPGTLTVNPVPFIQTNFFEPPELGRDPDTAGDAIYRTTRFENAYQVEPFAVGYNFQGQRALPPGLLVATAELGPEEDDEEDGQDGQDGQVASPAAGGLGDLEPAAAPPGLRTLQPGAGARDATEAFFSNFWAWQGLGPQ